MARILIPRSALHLPDSIAIPFLGGVWHVYAQTPTDAPLTLREDPAPLGATGGRLVLSGQTGRTVEACRLLREWLRRLARRCLPDHVHRMARRMGFTVTSVHVRAQRSRWGSCSSRGTVSLNCRLLLLPLHLLEHVIVHELCHLKHMNHSPTYRKFLQSFAPDWKQKEKMLHISWKTMPLWVIV